MVLVEVLVAQLVELHEPRVRQPVKPPVRQLLEPLELLDHRPLELYELLVRQLAEFHGQPVGGLSRSSLSRRILYVRHKIRRREHEERKKSPDPHRTAVEPK